MNFRFNTIDDFDLEDKTVLVRIDVNSPVDPNTGLILDDTRIQLHSETVDELSRKGAKTVILAHQSRAGKKDFTTLKQHAKVLSKILNHEVSYVDDLFGSNAREHISRMRKGDILLLENVRFYAEETLKRAPQEQAETHIVRNLSPLADYFINDAFAAAHRGQVSLVGFAFTLPAGVGRVMEIELKALCGVLEGVKRPCTYVLGGVKVDDSIMVMENVLNKGRADYILTTGVVANIFLWASGIDIGEYNKGFIESRNYKKCVDKASELMNKFDGKIIIPEDVAVSIDDSRREFMIEKIPNEPILDLGTKTINEYGKIIMDSKTIVANGPAGVFEREGFNKGTDEILDAIAISPGFSVIGGGHLAAAAKHLGPSSGINHISSGGGASISLLAGEKLPVIEVLKEVASKR